ncbi:MULTISPECIES: cytochrome c oxidase subunit 3 [Acidithiobacillus]|jgi:cytochrome o ubiquinol oxidase subunit 3|uniref:Cytochrome o ubiquinol oxidase n=1 Tax=Acidithiobacillus thiooxidans ATCC 19377 TaxID=637390 RepID=A0A5P9XN92_ACITH|nr:MULTISPECIES: cytochrome c oxidase subunit 3 [Acidithiobacillus]MBU2742930.1 cytochrome O ubiquinol oxidase [Acidithiobacillus albertensis]MBU2750880.1 cytochrome O ubiquinol oxidase [Acidithiobacillus thiooxidans]MBU2836360.1 cytochrome O ubiquinol oxidase [Acidithiobacillus thiooxidans]MDA8177360.1 cytochrome c oxidase subunit 3 [Acidithiobacillus sp.]QFX95258.1 cytochrome o ubiquinol oxidase [Acidithiobacillus thiooxidans ATCC 19377]
MSSHASTVDPKKAELWDTHHHSHDVISTRTLGYFLYLLSDGMLFATLFAAYGVLSYQHSYFGGPTPAEFVKPWYTFAQTIALFLSVLAYGFGMNALKHKNKSGLINGMLAAFVLGVVFLVLDIRDMSHLYSMGITLASSGGMSAFMVLTQVHATHIFFGLIWILVMIAQVMTKGFTEETVGRLLTLRMFWHLQAVIWVFVYIFVYLWGYIS